MLSEQKTTSLIANAYYKAALDIGSDMNLTTEALEIVRGELKNNPSVSVWSRIPLSKTKFDQPYLLSLLVDLKKDYQQELKNLFFRQLDQSFGQSTKAGWEMWFTSYMDFLLNWNIELCAALCNPSYDIPPAEKELFDELILLNQKILESRWVESYPIFQKLAGHTLTTVRQEALLEVILGEIEVYWLPNYADALKRFQKAQSLFPESSWVTRGFAEYEIKIGNIKSARDYIFKAISIDNRDIENYQLMGDSYKDEGNFTVAEQWYQDASNINFLESSPYSRLLEIYCDPSFFKEKQLEITSLLSRIEFIEKDLSFSNIVYNAYRTTGYGFSLNEKFSESENYYFKAINLHNSWIPAYIDLGYILAREEKYDEAKERFLQAMNLDENAFDVVRAFAWLSDQQKNFSEAIKFYEKSLKLQPLFSSDIYNNIGLLYSNLEDYSKAQENYKKAIAANPGNVLYYNNLAIASEKLNDFPTTEQAYQKVIELEPRNAIYFNKLGNLYFNQGLFEKARNQYIQAIKIEPSLAVYYENLGLACIQLNDWKSAKEAYVQASKLNPTVHNLNSLGNSCYYEGVYEEALEAYSKAIEAGNGEAILFLNLALTYEKLEKFADAEQAHLKAIDADPTNYTYQNQLGVFYYNRNKNELALERYKKAIEFGKGEAVLFSNIGLAYERLGLIPEAEQSYLQMIAAESNNHRNQNQLGVFYFDTGKNELAIECYLKAIDLSPEPIYWHNLALAYCNLGNQKEAEKAMDTAIALDGSDKYQSDLDEIKKRLA
ncbi:MAG: tetratricopeptide repeat protein [Saprospiraceae bacterium]